MKQILGTLCLLDRASITFYVAVTNLFYSIEEVFGDIESGELPPLDELVGLPDFEWAARKYLNSSAYTYYRNGAAGEWSYRNNLEVFSRYRLRPRTVVDITQIESTLRYGIPSE